MVFIKQVTIETVFQDIFLHCPYVLVTSSMNLLQIKNSILMCLWSRVLKYCFDMVPTLRTITNSSYYYEYQENIQLGVKLTPAKHFGSQTDVQHPFTYAVFILSFNILVSCNPEFVSFFRTFYWSTTVLKSMCMVLRMI